MIEGNTVLDEVVLVQNVSVQSGIHALTWTTSTDSAGVPVVAAVEPEAGTAAVLPGGAGLRVNDLATVVTVTGVNVR